MVRKLSGLLKLVDVLFVVLVFGFAVLWRVSDFVSAPPNLEFVTPAIFISGSLIFSQLKSSRMALIVTMVAPVVVAAISDAILGNSFLLLWTWGAWALIGLSFWLFRRLERGVKRYLGALGFAVFATAAFYLITNFGIWTMGWYEPTLRGLLQSYELALPFVRTQLIGNIIFTPLLVAIYDFVVAGLRALLSKGENETIPAL